MKALAEILAAILEALDAAGEGVPEGLLYAHLIGVMDPEALRGLVAMLLDARLVSRDPARRLTITDKGLQLVRGRVAQVATGTGNAEGAGAVRR